MKRFLEYLEDVKKREKRLLKEALPVNAHPYAREALDLTDGRKFVELDADGFEDAKYDTFRDRGFGPHLLMGKPKIAYSSVKGSLVLPVGGTEVQDSDSVSVAAVPGGKTVSCTAPSRNPGDGPVAVLIGIFRGAEFVRAFVSQASFNEIITLFMDSGAANVNPRLLRDFMNSARPVFEDAETVEPPKPAALRDDYDRKAVLAFVQNPRSHFNSDFNSKRGARYAAEIVKSGGDVGKVITVKPAFSAESSTSHGDNFVTDRNFLVATDLVTGRVFTVQKLTVRRLVSLFADRRGLRSTEYRAKNGLWLDRETLKRAIDDEASGAIV